MGYNAASIENEENNNNNNHTYHNFMRCTGVQFIYYDEREHKCYKR